MFYPLIRLNIEQNKPVITVNVFSSLLLNHISIVILTYLLKPT